MTDLIKAADALAELLKEETYYYTECDVGYTEIHEALSTYRQARESADGVKVKPLVWDETETGYMTQDYIGMYEVYLNAEGTWTFDSGESVSAHASKEAAMAQGPKEHLRRIKTALEETK